MKLVSAHLCSEEAALFVPGDQNRLEKVAVSGPDDQATKWLKGIELAYEGEQSLTRRVFESKDRLMLNHISTDEAYARDHSRRLPSGTTQHYLGVALRMGDEVLGVIRVLNKNTSNYLPEPGRAHLAEGGFKYADFELLTMIATQVASAIRNAKFIERNRYFENLVYNSPDPIIILDEGGKLRFLASRQKITTKRLRTLGKLAARSGKRQGTKYATIAGG